MIRVLRSLLLTTLASSACLAAPYPLRDVVECTPRGGIPNFLAKAKAGKALKIAYLGGSITAQNGWRPKTLKWFQGRFPKAKIQQLGVASGLDPEQVHTIKIEICEEQPEKREILKGRAGPNEKILALDDGAFAKKFDGRQWFAGYIMYIGEFVK